MLFALTHLVSAYNQFKPILLNLFASNAVTIVVQEQSGRPTLKFALMIALGVVSWLGFVEALKRWTKGLERTNVTGAKSIGAYLSNFTLILIFSLSTYVVLLANSLWEGRDISIAELLVFTLLILLLLLTFVQLLMRDTQEIKRFYTDMGLLEVLSDGALLEEENKEEEDQNKNGRREKTANTKEPEDLEEAHGDDRGRDAGP